MTNIEYLDWMINKSLKKSNTNNSDSNCSKLIKCMISVRIASYIRYEYLTNTPKKRLKQLQESDEQFSTIQGAQFLMDSDKFNESIKTTVSNLLVDINSPGGSGGGIKKSMGKDHPLLFYYVYFWFIECFYVFVLYANMLFSYFCVLFFNGLINWEVSAIVEWFVGY